LSAAVSGEAVILCEGFLDRSFWAGWLEHLGCPAPVPGTAVVDPAGRQVTKGHYGYYAGTRFVRVVPCHSRQNILPEARRRLAEREIDPLSRLVVCIDADTDAEQTTPATGLRVEDLEREIKQLAPDARRNTEGDIELDAGAVRVSLVRWECNDRLGKGIPARQTLERLVCAALVAAYPERAPAVQAWLDGRPNPPARNPKEHAWSYMAGWYADHGCEDFFREVWRDERVVPQLESCLKASGAWRVGAALVG